MYTLPFDLALIQSSLREARKDGWLLLGNKENNPIAKKALGGGAFLSRRFALWIPLEGAPTLLVHRIESRSLPPFDIPVLTYTGFVQWRKHLSQVVGGKSLLLEWHPLGEISYLSLIDGGVVDLLRELGCTLHSSADLAQHHFLLWNEKQMECHQLVARELTHVVHETFQRIRQTPPGGVDEKGVQQWMMDSFLARGIETDHPPIVAVDAHAGDPHYVPPKEGSSLLGADFVLLIDLWGCHPGPHQTYGDITWMARRGQIPEEADRAFHTILQARDAGILALETSFSENRFLPGNEVDRIVRGVVERSGFGSSFTHRTGHSLGVHGGHGLAAQIDSYEAEDRRLIESGWAGTIEPGIYCPQLGWGVRTEIDVVMHPGPIVTTPRQTEWVVI
ncbi:aminopeptidase P family protein [bacterium]|nr:aminopeptidase P family protein [bacterium]